ncbi:MAG: transcriptional repressor [Campylobacteraceae bacterium]|jgi:Fur family peroxide stress response transcriptional regulator|nr:transcriptional repressor [Campylobacteraceae bacterium]
MDFISLLKSKNLKATPQRLSVLEVLNKNEHPTIEELYDEIRREFPSISLATVYKNINTLKESDTVIEINTQNGKTRYDIYVKPHTHIICKKCGSIRDVDFLDSVHEYQQEIEKKWYYNIKRIDVTAMVDNCPFCNS